MTGVSLCAINLPSSVLATADRPRRYDLPVTVAVLQVAAMIAIVYLVLVVTS